MTGLIHDWIPCYSIFINTEPQCMACASIGVLFINYLNMYANTSHHLGMLVFLVSIVRTYPSDIDVVSDKGCLLDSNSPIFINLHHTVLPLLRKWELWNNSTSFQGPQVPRSLGPQVPRFLNMRDSFVVFEFVPFVDTTLFLLFDSIPVHLEVHRHEHVSAEHQLCRRKTKRCVINTTNSICWCSQKLLKGVFLVQILVLKVAWS